VGSVIGLLIVGLGLLGLVAPALLFRAVHWFQTPPALYLAALIRVAVGVGLFVAASASRARIALRVLGVLIAIGGVLTPFFGESIGQRILDWWSAGGAMLVRLWAAAALALGAFILWAVARPR
jgi:hypothetical protein